MHTHEYMNNHNVNTYCVWQALMKPVINSSNYKIYMIIHKTWMVLKKNTRCMDDLANITPGYGFLNNAGSMHLV